MKKIYSIIILILAVAAISCSGGNESFAGSPTAPDHSAWTKLLSKYVEDNGLVNYQGFINDKAALESYLETLSSNAPGDTWTENEKLAYWINAYNAFTVKLIVDNYPLKSIKDLNPTLSVPTVNTIWSKEWFQIGGQDFSLDRIEHKILRKDFEEPRIHFAVNCASISCPVLRPEAYTADKVDRQLDEQARIFLNDPTRNSITENRIEVSKIFSWFGGDFKKGQSLLEFIDQYTKVDIDDKAKVRFMKYDWNLNGIEGSN
ncbi:MAG: hypothetical protein Roseis2KO_23140 [Roseivirga sp.]